jgi:hypothetical protein
LLPRRPSAIALRNVREVGGVEAARVLVEGGLRLIEGDLRLVQLLRDQRRRLVSAAFAYACRALTSSEGGCAVAAQEGADERQREEVWLGHVRFLFHSVCRTDFVDCGHRLGRLILFGGCIGDHDRQLGVASERSSMDAASSFLPSS